MYVKKRCKSLLKEMTWFFLQSPQFYSQTPQIQSISIFIRFYEFNMLSNFLNISFDLNILNNNNTLNILN